jgi:hypothetical protein
VPGAFVASLLGLGILSIPYPGARVILGAEVCIYALAALVASVAAAAKAGWRLLPVLPAVFACYHLAYGLGFLAGVWDFVLLRRRGRFIGLTRG